MDTILNLDKDIILNINNFMQNQIILQKIFAFITNLGNGGAIWIVTGIGLILNKKTRRCGIVVLASLCIGALIGNLALKNIFERARPFTTLGLTPFIPAPTDFSFPSGHTLSSFTASTSIFLFYKKWGIVAFILAFLIAISRLLLLVHYPTDVLTGAIIGIFVAILTKKIVDKLRL